MGTNYYLSDGTHVGKRSAAGAYCADCKRTLCKLGWEKIHSSHSTDWHNDCPDCGKNHEKMGFACSFTWAIHPVTLIGKQGRVTDEYGTPYTMAQFGSLLRDCPFYFLESIGRDFS